MAFAFQWSLSFDTESSWCFPSLYLLSALSTFHPSPTVYRIFCFLLTWPISCAWRSETFSKSASNKATDSSKLLASTGGEKSIIRNGVQNRHSLKKTQRAFALQKLWPISKLQSPVVDLELLVLLLELLPQSLVPEMNPGFQFQHI